MASTPATGAIGVELQAAGENLNTWGDPKLNNALQVLVNLSHGWKAWTINGTYTVSETNYATTNDSENAFIKLVGGTVSAAFNVTYPGRAKRHVVWNATAYAATIKLSATTGFSLPSGRFAIVATDGVTDVYNVSPTYVGTGYTVQNDGDVANKAYVDGAIIAIAAAQYGLVLNSSSATTANYFNNLIALAGDLALSIQNAGTATEKSLITHTPFWATPTVVTTGTTAAADRGVYLCRTSTGAITIQLPASGRIQIIDVDGSASTNNITVDPGATQSIMDGANDENMLLDLNWFSGQFTLRTAGTNWSVS